ncbi:M28 family peptidase [Zavarzinella formosa]|uniref:M28 family peptidase n=1 Tax=Zavarzinella formosa TaxID=360055 RepID=UPI000319E098|nr:M28 family peptidase [Zavarzinella formosa]
MRQKTWMAVSAGIFATLAGVLVFLNFGNAKPPAKKDPTEPEARKAGDFDGDRAIKYLKDLCDLGPRISGSPEMKKQQEIIKAHFEKCGATVTFQKFEGKQPSQRFAVPMVNIIVSWNPEIEKRVMICGHYDTRPIADQETNVRDWTKPFVSANDGTSTVAFMMELGTHVKNLKCKYGVDFVIFDGEEFVHERNNDKYFLGSEYFAAEYKKNKTSPRYSAGILLDLFAGAGAEFPYEPYSMLHAGQLVEDIWKIAGEVGVKSFINRQGTQVLDDHIALNKVGIPCIDIIDFDYPQWHRLDDLPEKCSPVSMANMAKVLMAWLTRIE